MSSVSPENHFQSLFSAVGRSRIWKVLVVVLSVQVVWFAVTYYQLYPVDFPAADILYAYGYWTLLLTLIVTATALAYFVRSPLSSFISTLLVYLVLYSNQLLRYSIPGGDTTGELIDLALMARLTTVWPEHISDIGYLYWPLNYIFALVLKRTLEIESVVATFDIGHAVYSLLFVIAVWQFAYRLNDELTAFLASVAYLILSRPVLNNQYVPQFLALILLLFIFLVGYRDGFEWRVLEFVLFVALLHTHLVFPVFYLLALTLRPGVRVVTTYLESNTVSEIVSGVDNFHLRILHRLRSLNAWAPDVGVTYTRVFALWTMYVVKNPPSLIKSNLLPPEPGTEGAGNPIIKVLVGLFPIAGGGSSSSASRGVERVLLYELVPKSVDSLVTWGTRAIVVVLFSVLVLAFVYQQLVVILAPSSNEVVDYRVEIIVACAALFVYTSAISASYGIRTLQLAFLPIASFFYGLQRYRSAVMGVIVLVALFSPIMLANGYVNSTITGGGNAIGYHETQAGQVVGRHYDGADIIVPPHTPEPVGQLDEPGHTDIRAIVYGEADVPRTGVVMHSDRFRNYLEYRGYACRPGGPRATTVYDNGAKVTVLRADSRFLSCLRSSTSGSS